MTGGLSWNIVTDFRAIWEYAFMRQAYEAGTIVAVLAGIIGYFVVLRRTAFAAHALGHVGFSGAAAAVVYSVNPVYGLLAFTMSGGVGMALLGRKAATRDIEIGTVLAFMMGLGLIFLSLYKGYATQAYSILFGDIEGVTVSGVYLTLEGAIVVLIVLAVIYRPLLFSSLDEDVAEAKGLPLLALNVVFMLLLAVAISFAVQVVGVLLVFALTVTPAATAVRITKRPLYAITASVAIGLVAIWAGLFISWWPPYSQYPPSFFIVTISFAAYMLVRLGSSLTDRFGHRAAPSVGAKSDPIPVPKSSS
jgi:zinc/manganese transport system permease protein